VLVRRFASTGALTILTVGIGAIFVLVASSIGACSSFTESAATEQDASPAGDAATTSDTAAPVDGSAMPVDSGDAATPKFCETLADPTFALCTDFDDGQPAEDGFETIEGDGGTIDTQFFVSAPASARFVGAAASPAIERQFSASPDSYELLFKMRLGNASGDAPLAGTSATPIRLYVPGCSVSLLLSNNGSIDISDGVSQNDRIPLQRRPTPGQWASYRLVIKRTTPPTVTFEKDGMSSIDPTSLSFCTFTGDPTLLVGMLYAQGVEVRFDDIVFYRR